MRKKYFIFIFIFAHLWLAAEASAALKHASASCSPIDSSGYIFLHPYFDGKNWANTYNRVDLIIPDTLCLQKIRPIAFDIGKNIDSTMALFSTADGSLFTMAARFSPYIDPCWDGEVGFSAPVKLNLSGFSFSATTPFYLIKDSLYNFDSLKVVLGASSQFLLVLTLNTGAGSIIKVDTLRMQSATAAVRISGEFSSSLKRDTSIWVSGPGGMIRSFSYKRTGWGSEVNRNITGLSDTVLCVNGLYAGTNTGKIYKKNASQIFSLDYAASTKAISALYPQGAIGKNGNFVELIGNTWTPNTIGAADYRYANFIKRSGGFGVELLDSKWHYSIFTYKDSSSQLLLTIPTDVSTYKNNGAYQFPRSFQDTGFTVYFLDPDSNFKDINFKIMRGNTAISLKTNGTDTIRAVNDSAPCGVNSIGAVRLTNGVVNFKLSGSSVAVSAQTQKNTTNTCGCYWKKFTYTDLQSWQRFDTLVITAGKDALKIVNNVNAVATTGLPELDESINGNGFSYRIVGNKLVFNGLLPNLKSITAFDSRGREIASTYPASQKTFEMPIFSSTSIVYLRFLFSNGKIVQRMTPILR